MSTTQSINIFFDGYVDATTPLKKFVGDYDNALMRMVENERLANFGSFNRTIPCITLHAIERQLQDVYTSSKFKEIQVEFRKFMNCLSSSVKCECAICTCEVVDRVRLTDDFMKEVKYCMYFNDGEFEVKCTCRLFEFRGILYRHALIVLTMWKRVDKLPSKYILDRWRKDLKRKYKFVKSSYDDLHGNPEAQRYNDLCNYFEELALIASKNHETYTATKSHLDELKARLLDNGKCVEIMLCSPLSPSHHTPGEYTISNEATDGKNKKLRSCKVS